MFHCGERVAVNPTRLNAHELNEEAPASPQCAPEAPAPLHAPKQPAHASHDYSNMLESSSKL